jgi:hypothetical protein
MSAPFPSRNDLFDIGARELLARSSLRPPGQRVTAKAVYTTGTNVNSALAAIAAMGDECVRHIAIRQGEGFLDSAEDSAADRLVADHIDNTMRRKQPSRAIVTLALARTLAGGGAAYTQAAGSIIRTETGVEVKTKTDVYFAVNAVGPLSVEAEAVLAGTIGNVDERTLTQFAQQPTDGSLTVTNLEPAVGGDDVETTRDFVARARLSRKAARGGTVEAVRLGALSVDGVRSVQVLEELDGNGNQTGALNVYLADVNGRSNSALIARVRAALLNYRCAGSVPRILSSSPLYSPIAYAVVFGANTDQAAATSQLVALTVAAVNLLQPGATLERSMLYAIARKVSGIAVPASAVTTPAADLVPLPTQTIKTRSDLVTATGI